MNKFLSFIILVSIVSIKVSGQSTATATASAMILEAVGATMSTDLSEGKLPVISKESTEKVTTASFWGTQDGIAKPVELANVTIIGSSFAYAVTLPAEQFKLSTMDGNESLTIQSFQMIKTNNNDENSQSIVIQQVCKPNAYQIPGYHAAPAPIDIIINYN